MIVTMSAAVGTTFGLEGRAGFFHLQAQPEQHVLEYGIAFELQA